MIIKLFLIGIILYIIINQLSDNTILNNKIQNQEQPVIQQPVIQQPVIQQPVIQTNQPTRLQNNIEKPQLKQPMVEKLSNHKIQEFDDPRPWTKIIYIEDDDFPYYYHIKIRIPSLNDFERWKQIIPNLDFNPISGELIIPCKEEASALAVANLICINFSGQMNMENIINKDLIRISIHKSRSHELVRTKLRDQIVEVIYGKVPNNVQINYEEDLAKNDRPVKNEIMSLKSENFRDTFEHFHDNHLNGNEISAYDSSSYSYI